MVWTLPEPMLTAPVPGSDLPPGHAAEPKWDGYRAQLARWSNGRILLRSRRGTDMTPAFPEIRASAAQLPDNTALDGELVVWDASGRLAFERLNGRLTRRSPGAGRLASQWPAHFVAFDLLRLHNTDLTPWPYHRRRAALEELFTGQKLSGALALCPSTTDPDTARQWLDWTAAGLEGLVFKHLQAPYRPGTRGWSKYKVRITTEAIVGAVTGTLAAPRTLLLGRYDDTGRLQYIGRTSTLSATTAANVTPHLSPVHGKHPWRGWTFSAGWGTHEKLDPILVQPRPVAEVAVDVARDTAGRWRHPVKLQRIRTDLKPDDIPQFTGSASEARRQAPTG
ncbi:ATP-dependent DNA ligase [Streptomyces sp. NPDC005574]|uniref:ATP-dependent DNA ligase n=1 Tax=Streptomyces sp. NPDC005574 TaxID=3156891 RepID=UPI0033BCCB9A